MVTAIVQRLAERLLDLKWMMATAESCTGGMIAAHCTDLAGSSAWFERGFVTYSNEAKTELLGVPASLIAIRHDCEPFFTLTVQLREVAGGTHVLWQQAFDDKHVAQAVKAIVEPANEQNLDRLTQLLGLSA